MSKVWQIAAREFVVTVFTKGFLIGLLIVPFERTTKPSSTSVTSRPAPATKLSAGRSELVEIVAGMAAVAPGPTTIVRPDLPSTDTGPGDHEME